MFFPTLSPQVEAPEVHTSRLNHEGARVWTYHRLEPWPQDGVIDRCFPVKALQSSAKTHSEWKKSMQQKLTYVCKTQRTFTSVDGRVLLAENADEDTSAGASHSQHDDGDQVFEKRGIKISAGWKSNLDT